MHSLRYKKLIRYFSLSLFLFLVLLVSPALSSDVVEVPVCAAPSAIGTQGLEFFERGYIEPTPEAIPLFYLPRDQCGFVDWAKALRQGILAPRDSIKEKRLLVKDVSSPGDIVFNIESFSVADVIFSHDTHGKVLECKSCHPGIFKDVAGTSGVRMVDIAQGEYCGRCHGKVSFPLLNCTRCHDSSVENDTNK